MSNTYKGIAVNSGSCSGRACVISENEDLDNIEICNDTILVVPQSNPQYSIHLFNSIGLVCENGAVMSHICIVAGELGIPCITQVKGITSAIKTGDRVFLNGESGEITIL